MDFGVLLNREIQLIEVAPRRVRRGMTSKIQMLSREETEHIAKLARLGLSEDEIAKYQKDLSAILGYVDKLKEVDIDGIEPFTHSIELVNVLREDEAVVRAPEDTAKLIREMPESQDGYLKVKSVF